MSYAGTEGALQPLPPKKSTYPRSVMGQLQKGWRLDSNDTRRYGTKLHIFGRLTGVRVNVANDSGVFEVEKPRVG